MRLLLLSNAKREGFAYLAWAESLLADFFQPAGVGKILFVPFAGVSTGPDAYVDKVRATFSRLGIEVEGVHAAADPVAAVNAAQAVVVGGGSTWKLLRDVRALRLLRAIRQRALAECLTPAGAPVPTWPARAS